MTRGSQKQMSNVIKIHHMCNIDDRQGFLYLKKTFLCPKMSKGKAGKSLELFGFRLSRQWKIVTLNNN